MLRIENIKNDIYKYMLLTELNYFWSSAGLSVQPATSLRLSISAPADSSSNADLAAKAKAFLDTYSEVFYLDGDDEFNTDDLGTVCSKYPYGYQGATVSPCIFLTLTNIGDWEPNPIPEEDFAAGSFPFSSSFKEFWDSQGDKEQVFVDCSSSDTNAIEYFPASRGFELKYFPITDGDNVPIVAIQISGLSAGTYNFECKAYYKGVKFTSDDTYTSTVSFSLEMIDGK